MFQLVASVAEFFYIGLKMNDCHLDKDLKQTSSHVHSANESLDMLEGRCGHKSNGKRKYFLL